MQSIPMNEIDVLVIGAGPVGLTAASELLRRGVRCRILDKAASPATTSRANGIQPRTLELFDLIQRFYANEATVHLRACSQNCAAHTGRCSSSMARRVRSMAMIDSRRWLNR